MKHLITTWQAAREAITPSFDAEVLISKAIRKKKQALSAQYINIAILSALLLILSFLFFHFIDPVSFICRIGALLMLIGLGIRILIEVFSLMKANKVVIQKEAIITTRQVLHFHLFRKKVHGPVTISIVLLYCLGFFLFMSEFGAALLLPYKVMIYGSFILGALFLISHIRKEIRKEMRHLDELISLQQDMETEK